MAVLEKSDPSFQALFYPKALRCPLAKRIVRAIEEHWPAYFPTRKECRGPNWRLTIRPDEPLYKPRSSSVNELNAWKMRITGTIVEGRAHYAHASWKRFFEICRKSPRLHPVVRDFKPLADFLIKEESMRHSSNGAAVGMEDFLQKQMTALLAPGSPYLFSDPQRLRFLQSRKPPFEKIQAIDLMTQLFDGPLMILAVLQRCASGSKNSCFWLDLQNHIKAVLKAPAPLAFRATWLEHAMHVANATKKSGKSCPRKWAQLLIDEKERDLAKINVKAIEVNNWLKGKKQPSVENIRRAWQAVVTAGHLPPKQAKAGQDSWLFSWMITLWLEWHFVEIAAEFKGDTFKIRRFYSRFFHYLKIDFNARTAERAGGRGTRQP